MNKCVVTVNFNIHGKPFESPKVNNKLAGWDYVLFSNIEEITRNDSFQGWKVIKKPLINNHPIYTAKYYKWLILKELPKYDRAIYVDSYLEPTFDKPWDSLNESCFYLNPHPKRNCIYSELPKIASFRRDTKANMERVRKFLEEQGFPKEFGLWGTYIFNRSLKSPLANKICEELYDLMKVYSYRDQSMLSYVLWKNNFRPNDLVINNSWGTKTSRSVARQVTYVRNGKRIYD